MRKLFCIIGLPCSGKSHAAKLLARTIYNDQCTIISAGDIARELSTTQELKSTTAANDLFPLEDLLRSKIEEKISGSPHETILLEGLPRFGDQATWVLNTFWHLFPEIIEVNVGDEVTLFNRARMRGRDSDANFSERLTKAKSNLAGVYDAMHTKLVPVRMLLNSGDDASTVTQFKKLFNIKKV